MHLVTYGRRRGIQQEVRQHDCRNVYLTTLKKRKRYIVIFNQNHTWKYIVSIIVNFFWRTFTLQCIHFSCKTHSYTIPSNSYAIPLSLFLVAVVECKFGTDFRASHNGIFFSTQVLHFFSSLTPSEIALHLFPVVVQSGVIRICEEGRTLSCFSKRGEDKKWEAPMLLLYYNCFWYLTMIIISILKNVLIFFSLSRNLVTRVSLV